MYSISSIYELSFELCAFFSHYLFFSFCDIDCGRIRNSGWTGAFRNLGILWGPDTARFRGMPHSRNSLCLNSDVHSIR